MEQVAELAPPSSLGSLILGVFTAPARTMAAVVERPTWVVPLVICALLSGIGSAVIYKPIIVPMQIVKMEEKSQASNAPSEQLDQMEEQMSKPMWTWITAGGWMIGSVVFTLLMAGFLYFVGSLVLGGQSTFRTIFAVVAWASLIPALSLVIQTPIRLLRVQGLDPADYQAALESVVGLGFLVPASSGSFVMGMLRGVLGTIELFWLWQCAVLVEGVSRAFHKPRSFGITSVVVLWILSAILSGIAGGFAANS